VFDLSVNDRLTEWKKFRDSLETDTDPLKAVSLLWSQAPFVNPYLNPNRPDEWPNPWQLVLGNRLDDLAIALGMLYTIKLTQRFIDSKCEIHMSILKKNDFYLVIDNKHVLNYEPRVVHDISVLDGVQTSTIWCCEKLK